MIANSESSLALFLFFMPRSLWKTIAHEPNPYRTQQLMKRVDKLFERQREGSRMTKAKLTEIEPMQKDVQAYKIVVCLGQLVARILNQHSRQFTDHWTTTATGAMAPGMFGWYMPRNRFQFVMRNLHFTNNSDATAAHDRAWKVRSLTNVLQCTLQQGFRIPVVLAFDEAMLPSRSRYNHTRMYMKNKPQRWETELFMTCCAEAAYCLWCVLHLPVPAWLRWACLLVCISACSHVRRRDPKGLGSSFYGKVEHVVLGDMTHFSRLAHVVRTAWRSTGERHNTSARSAVTEPPLRSTRTRDPRPSRGT